MPEGKGKLCCIPDLHIEKGNVLFWGYSPLGTLHQRQSGFCFQGTRRQILHCVLFNELPRVNSPDYVEEWGVPRTDKRLKKMAESIASFARNAKRNNSTSMKYAIADWENDLSYLFKNYYHRSLGFCWPDTGV